MKLGKFDKMHSNQYLIHFFDEHPKCFIYHMILRYCFICCHTMTPAASLNYQLLL